MSYLRSFGSITCDLDLVTPSSGSSCVPESSNNVLLVCYLSLLVVETSKIYVVESLPTTDKESSVIVVLTLWQGYRLCTTSCMTGSWGLRLTKNDSFSGWKCVSALSACSELLPRRFV